MLAVIPAPACPSKDKMVTPADAVPDSCWRCYRRYWVNQVYGPELALDAVGSPRARKARLLANLATELAAVPLMFGLLIAPLVAAASFLLLPGTGTTEPSLALALAGTASLVAAALNLAWPTTALTAAQWPLLYFWCFISNLLGLLCTDVMLTVMVCEHNHLLFTFFVALTRPAICLCCC